MPTRNVLALIAFTIIALVGGWHLWQSFARTRPERTQDVHQDGAAIQVEPSELYAKTKQAAPAAHAGPLTIAIAADGSAEVPVRYRFPGVDRVRTAKNFKQWLAQFAPDQQAVITDFDKTHFSVYDTVTSPEQVAWMAQRGYPMPEDILAVKGMSDDDLRRLFDQGNDKAGFLLYERMSERVRARITAYEAGGEKVDQLFKEDPAFSVEAAKTRMFMQSLSDKSESAYKGYAVAYDASFDSDPLARSTHIIAGLMWASMYGDSRAKTDALGRYVQDDPDLNRLVAAASAMSLFTTEDQSRLNCLPATYGSRIPDKVWR
ncbi:MAG: hypothetical protein JSR65_02705 [Proteobacteria bacterium]|nr:hypothetical protein [Pseudomonadota bacterium]